MGCTIRNSRTPLKSSYSGKNTAGGRTIWWKSTRATKSHISDEQLLTPTRIVAQATWTAQRCIECRNDGMVEDRTVGASILNGFFKSATVEWPCRKRVQIDVQSLTSRDHQTFKGFLYELLPKPEIPTYIWLLELLPVSVVFWQVFSWKNFNPWIRNRL